MRMYYERESVGAADDGGRKIEAYAKNRFGRLRWKSAATEIRCKRQTTINAKELPTLEIHASARV